MWTIVWDLIAGSQIFAWVVAGVAGLAALFLHGKSQRRKGAKDKERELEIRDHENAKDIRDRVDRELDDELREHEQRGFRDDE